METLLTMLSGGALVLAGIFLGEWLHKPASKQTQAMRNAPGDAPGNAPGDAMRDAPQISEADIRRAKELRSQWESYMSYNGREQKAGDER